MQKMAQPVRYGTGTAVAYRLAVVVRDRHALACSTKYQYLGGIFQYFFSYISENHRHKGFRQLCGAQGGGSGEHMAEFRQEQAALLVHHSGVGNGRLGKEAVANTPFVIVAPSEEIIVSFPLIVFERGVVDSIDVKNSTFTLKEQDGTLTTIKVTENTMIENIYLDIFNWESKKGINDLKKGEKIRAAVFPAEKGQPATAVSMDVYKF